MRFVTKPHRHSGDSARPVALAIRRIGPGAKKRLFAYSGIQSARTFKLVLEQACRLVAALPGVCEIEVFTMGRSGRTGRHADAGPRGQAKSIPRPSRSAAALDRSRRKLLAKADGFDQPDLRRPRHRAARWGRGSTLDMIASGTIQDAKSIAGLHLAAGVLGPGHKW